MKALTDHIYDDLFPAAVPKSQQTKLRILEAAIECYVKFGIESSTYDKIAEMADVTRPLVIRYFPDKDEIFRLAAQYIRANLQKMAVDAMAGLSDAKDLLRAYIQSTFTWIEKYPKHARVWLLFYYYCGIRRETRKVNTDLVTLGHERITALLKLGKQQGTFNTKTLSISAKNIQNCITGALLSLLTEDLSSKDLVTPNAVMSACLAIAQGNH